MYTLHRIALKLCLLNGKKYEYEIYAFLEICILNLSKTCNDVNPKEIFATF